MVVKETATIFGTPNGCRTWRAVECLVSPDLSESDPLLSWGDRKRPIWGSLPVDFPKVKDLEEVSCKKVKTTETNEDDDEKKNREMKEMLIKEYSTVFCERLGPEDRMLGPPTEREIEEGDEYQPTNVTVACPIPRHMRSAAERETDNLIANGFVEQVHHSTPHCSATHFVLKKNMDARMVIDFCPINKILKHPVKWFKGSEQIKKTSIPKPSVMQ